MSNQTSAEQLVSSKFSKWKLKYARLTTYEKVIKVLTLLTTLLMLCFLTCVALNIIEIVSCETSYGNVIASEKEYQNGKFVGYKNTYLIYYDNVYDSHISSTLVNKQYNAGTSLKVYLKKQGDTLIVSEYYKTEPALLVCTITFATLLSGVCIANLVLSRKDKIFKSKLNSLTKKEKLTNSVDVDICVVESSSDKSDTLFTPDSTTITPKDINSDSNKSDTQN